MWFLIEVRCLGYQSQKIEKETSGDTIWLIRNGVNLNEVAVTASYAPAPAMQSAYASTCHAICLCNKSNW